MHQDEKKWESPLDFKPSRWLDIDGTTILLQQNFVPFSIGKRRCLGENLAKIEFFSFAVHLMCKLRFKMENPDHLPSLKGYGGAILSPDCFKIVMEVV
jgi:cytochrome P450